MSLGAGFAPFSRYDQLGVKSVCPLPFTALPCPIRSSHPELASPRDTHPLPHQCSRRARAASPFQTHISSIQLRVMLKLSTHPSRAVSSRSWMPALGKNISEESPNTAPALQQLNSPSTEVPSSPPLSEHHLCSHLFHSWLPLLLFSLTPLFPLLNPSFSLLIQPLLKSLARLPNSSSSFGVNRSKI